MKMIFESQLKIATKGDGVDNNFAKFLEILLRDFLRRCKFLFEFLENLFSARVA